MKQRETKKCPSLLANFNVCPFPAVPLRTVLLQHFVSNANGQRGRQCESSSLTPTSDPANRVISRMPLATLHASACASGSRRKVPSPLRLCTATKPPGRSYG